MFTIKAADLFCGAGGASTGLIRAVRAAGFDIDLLAVNHWPVAVETHSLNHPGVRHLCEEVDRINPREAVPGGRLHLLLAGPECTHHSTARGGRPINEQSRATAWHILKWAQELYIDCILIENVPEFRTWGPLGANGRPMKSRKGQTYRAFLDALRSLGYRVEDRVINAADYGDPTTRQRLFILAQRGQKRVSFPMPTHSRSGGETLFGKTRRWRAAREVIDWHVPGQSIFNRKKPLAPATMARILAGLEKFGGKELEPFLVVLRNHAAGRSLKKPLPTISAQGQHIGLAQPFIVPVNHGADSGHKPRSVDEPLPTLTARANQYLVQPYVLGQQTGSVARSTDQPLPTVATDGAIGLVEPFLVPLYGERPTQDPRTHSIDEPVPTIPATGGGKFGIAQPVLIQNNETRDARARSVEDPLPTITAMGGRCIGVAQPFITKYNGTARTRAYSVDDPLDTVSTKDRFGLVQPCVNGYVLDIHFRMLQPHELAQAMSFPKSYQFTGNRGDVVKQIGNAWPGETATALCSEILKPYARARKEPWRAERTA